MAEGIFRHVLADRIPHSAIRVDSAGTGPWHVGNLPDPRSIETASRYGIDITGQRARQVAASDFHEFDLIVGMDRSNVESLKAICPKDARADIRLFLDEPPTDVPDPYYGGPDGFETVYRMLRAGSLELVSQLPDPTR